MAKTHKLKDIHIKKGDIRLDINMSRLERNLNDAQYGLDSAVMHSMIPYMPKVNGTFIDVTQAMSQAIAGSGKVVAAARPFGRYLYEGKVMVDSVTGKGPYKIPTGPGEYKLRFRKGAKLKATDRPLQYFKGENPKVTDHWFEAAKEKDLAEWEKIVAREMGKK